MSNGISSAPPATAPPSAGRNIPGGAIVLDGNGEFFFDIPRVIESLELTSLTVTIDGGSITADLFPELQWLDGENEEVASAWATKIPSGGASPFRYTWAKHFGHATQDRTAIGGGFTHVQAPLPVDTLVDRNTTLRLRLFGQATDPVTVGTIRVRMRRDRDRKVGAPE